MITKCAIVRPDQRVLILQRSSTDEIAPREVDLPGGRLEYGENPDEGMHREVLEETGLEVTLIAPARAWSFVKDNVYRVGITYAALNRSGEVCLSGEHSHSVWMSLEEIESSRMPDWIKLDLRAAYDTLDHRSR